MTDTRDHVTDPRLCFYLERRAQIDDWAAIGDREPAELDRFLLTLEEDVERLCEDLGPPAQMGFLTVDRESMLGLYHETWCWDDERPAAVVQVGWYPHLSRFKSADNPPWVGLRVRRSGGYASLRERVGDAVSADPSTRVAFPNGNARGKSVWVRYRPLECAYDRYWEDLGPYRQQLIGSLRIAYETFAPIVDAAITSWPGPNDPALG